jgi:competence protein ComEC
VRTVAAIPASGLLGGAAIGLLVPDLFLAVPLLGLAVGCAAVVYAWRVSRAALLGCAVVFAFGAGGAASAIDAWREAWDPPLRRIYEGLAREDRAAAAAGDRRRGDDSVQLALTGILRADAAVNEHSVSLSVGVNAIGRLGSRIGRQRLESSRDEAEQGAGESGDVPVRGGIQLSVAGALARERVDQWRAGRTVRVTARVRRPSRYLNPGVLDQERTLARRGTRLVGSVKSGALVEVVSIGHPPAELAASARAMVRRVVQRAVGKWSARSAAIVTAILVGDRAGLDEDVAGRLQRAGTYHVIAISGGNIAILAGLALALFRLGGFLGRIAMLTAIAGLTGYAYLTGGGASINRATLMAALYFAGRIVDLRSAPLNGLALAAGVFVAIDPLAVADAAFLLTFGATAGILVIVPPVGERFLALLPGRLVRSAAAIFAASIAAEAMLLPVGAYLFSRVTFAGLVLNFAAIPLMAVIQVAGLALVPLAALSADAAAAVGWVAHAGAEGLVRSADLVEVMPWLTWRVAAPDPAVAAAYYGGLGAAWTLWRRQAVLTGSAAPAAQRLGRRAGLVLAVASAFWMLAEPWRVAAARGDGRLRVTFIDVGQGDAVHVRFPRGRALLVDAGGLPAASSFDIGDRIVGAVLRHEGVRRLDTVAITHGDADHSGGALSVVREFRPREVWEGVPVPPFEPLRALRRAAGAGGARWATLQTHDAMWIDDVQLVVRHPGRPDWERQDVRNDDSLVLELLWRDVSVVLTGDIGRDVERQIAPLFPQAPLRVVKVPHHGSLTSSSLEFVDALKPRVAIVSVGRGNPFGHPAPAVLERYHRIGAEVFRTDREGAVMLDTDGYTLNVKTFTGRTMTVP